jgi:hypothetical protein
MFDGMENSKSSRGKWLAVSFFLPVSLAFIGLVYYLVTFARHPADRSLQATAEKTAVQPLFGRNIILPQGRPQTIGRLQLTYRGMQADHVLIDVTLLDMDPNYTYRHRIPRPEAASGFRLAHLNVKLISSGRSGIKLAPGIEGNSSRTSS